MPSLYDRDREGTRRAYPLERAWVRHKLIRQIATGESTNADLARQYGVSDVAISAFRSRHQTEIEEVQADLENQFAALWIANKAARLAELQQDVEDVSGVMDADMLKVKHSALKQAAEELGQLPSRYNLQVNTNPITYRIDGVDMDQLR